MNNLALALKYADDVRDGKILVNRYVKLAVDRHFRDLEIADSKGWYFSDKGAEKALKYFNFLVLTKGVTRATVPKEQVNPDGTIRFQLAPWQAFLIASLFGWKKKENRKRRFTEAYVEIPKKNGKALALDTPIPTPNGWSTMGDLQVGDQVYSENFKRIEVLGTTEVMHDHDCYEILFSDGAKVTADAGHLWKTQVGVFTTEELRRKSSLKWVLQDNKYMSHAPRWIKRIKKIDSVPVRCIQVDNPTRLFLCTRSYVPTHNSTLASGIATYMLIADKEAGPEVYFGAYSRDQASICFNEAVAQIKDSKELRRQVNILKYAVTIPKTRAQMMAVSHDGNNTEGKNGSGVIIDEYHVHKTDKVKDSLQTGTSARDQPLVFVVTTAGYNKQGPCYKHREVLIGMLEQKYDLDNVFTLIYGLDEGDDWKDEDNWIKANPTIGVTTKIAVIRSEYQMALRSGSKEVDFKTKRLNMWVDAAVTWIPSETWKACKRLDDTWEPEEGAICYGGIDLGRSSDISSVAFFFPKYNYLTVKHYVAKEAAEYAVRNGIDYNEWIKEGFIKDTPGRTTGYDFIHEDILSFASRYEVKFIGHDPYGAQIFKDRLADELGTTQVYKKKDDGTAKLDNYPVVHPVRQGFLSLGPPTALFEEMVVNGQLKHDGNPVTAWMLGNVQLDTDAAGNIKPTKRESMDKIDGIVASIMSLSVYTEWHPSVSSQTGILAW